MRWGWQRKLLRRYAVVNPVHVPVFQPAVLRLREIIEKKGLFLDVNMGGVVDD